MACWKRSKVERVKRYVASNTFGIENRREYARACVFFGVWLVWKVTSNGDNPYGLAILMLVDCRKSLLVVFFIYMGSMDARQEERCSQAAQGRFLAMVEIGSPL